MVSSECIYLSSNFAREPGMTFPSSTSSIIRTHAAIYNFKKIFCHFASLLFFSPSVQICVIQRGRRQMQARSRSHSLAHRKKKSRRTHTAGFRKITPKAAHRHHSPLRGRSRTYNVDRFEFLMTLQHLNRQQLQLQQHAPHRLQRSGHTPPAEYRRPSCQHRLHLEQNRSVGQLRRKK